MLFFKVLIDIYFLIWNIFIKKSNRSITNYSLKKSFHILARGARTNLKILGVQVIKKVENHWLRELSKNNNWLKLSILFVHRGKILHYKYNKHHLLWLNYLIFRHQTKVLDCLKTIKHAFYLKTLIICHLLICFQWKTNI